MYSLQLTRRALLKSMAAALAHVYAGTGDHDLDHLCVDIERRLGGRLGVAIIDIDGRVQSHRGDERFPLCSTHKVLAAACILARVDRGAERLDRTLHFTKADLVAYSPVLERHVDGKITVGDACVAAMTVSDNTAANLLLDAIGGPSALTSWLRSIGDPVTRLDRREPALNTAIPGEPRDTTSPRAMARTVRTLLHGQVLRPESRDRLADWMERCTTGNHRLRAGIVGSHAVAGDKTGTGDHGATNDVAFIRLPNRPPTIVAAYYVDSAAPMSDRERALALIGRYATGR